MCSSTWEVVTDRQDDRRALAEPQGVTEPIKGPGPAGNAAGRTLEVEGGSGTGTEGEEATGKAASASQYLPSRALWLSSGSPQYCHLALGNTSAAIGPRQPRIPGAKTAAASSSFKAHAEEARRTGRGVVSPGTAPRARRRVAPPHRTSPRKRPFPELLGAPAPPTLAPPPKGRGLRPPFALPASPRCST